MVSEGYLPPLATIADLRSMARNQKLCSATKSRSTAPHFLDAYACRGVDMKQSSALDSTSKLLHYSFDPFHSSPNLKLKPKQDLTKDWPHQELPPQVLPHFASFSSDFSLPNYNLNSQSSAYWYKKIELVYPDLVPNLECSVPCEIILSAFNCHLVDFGTVIAKLENKGFFGSSSSGEPCITMHRRIFPSFCPF